MAKKIINVVYQVDDKALLKAKTEIQGIEKETKDSEKEMTKLDKAIQNTGSNGAGSMLSFKNVLSTISTAALVAGFVQLGKKIFELGVKQEQLNIAFTTFLGSVSKARTLLAELTKFSIVTPFTPDQVNNAAKALLAFGVSGKEIIPTLKMLGDVSSGTGKDLTEMAIIFGQIRSTGRLMGQDLLQLINAGFNPLQIISQKTGKSVASLKEEMEKGAISFEMVADAFKSATSEGGLFFNLMEKQSASIGGVTSTISGNLEEMGKQIFEVFQGGTAAVTNFFAEWTSGLIARSEAEQKAFKLSAEVYLFQQKQLLESNQTLEERRKTMQRIVEVEMALNKYEPGTTEDPLPWAKGLEGTQTIGIIEGLNKKLEAFKIARDRALSPQEIKTITAEIKDLEKQLKLLTGSADDKKLEQRTKAFDRMRKAWKMLANDIYEGNKESDEKASKAKSDQTTRELKQDADRADTLKANNKDMEDERTRQAEEAAEERIRIANEEAQRKKDLEKQFTDFVIGSIETVLYATLLGREEDFTSQQEQFDKEMALAGDNERAKEQIKVRQEAAEKAFRVRQKEEERKAALKKIAIDTAINVIRSIANNGGIPYGLPFGALALAAGLVQAAAVRKLAKGEVLIDGPGTTTSDSIPAMLSKNESVINAKASQASPNLLNAINDRKIDDRILHKMAANGGSQVFVNDNRDVIKAINDNAVDYEKHGYTLMKVKGARTNFRRYMRSKTHG